MLLQCPVCRLSARVPHSLEGKAVQCPRCKTVGYAGRRPGGLADLQPLHEGMEADHIDEYLNRIEQELAGPLPEELSLEKQRDVAFYDLPGAPPYEEMLKRELGFTAKKPAHSAHGERLARTERWVRRGQAPAAAREPLTAALLCRCGFGAEMAEECRGRAMECPECRERVVVGSPPWTIAADPIDRTRRERDTEPSDAAAIRHDNPVEAFETSRGEGFTQRRTCPRVETSEIVAQIESGRGLLLRDISVSGLGVAPGGVSVLRPGDRVRIRLTHAGDGSGLAPQEFLSGLPPMEAQVVRVDDGGAGLVFTSLDGITSRRLAGLVARLARQRNQSGIPEMQEAQGF